MKFLETYNLVDLFIVGTFLMTFVLGLWKGFFRSLTALAGLVGGVIAAVKYHSAVGPYLSKVSSLDPQIATILSMVLVFIGVQIVFVVIRRILEALLNVTRLSWLDRILGSAMGLAGGFLVVAAAVSVLLIALPELQLVRDSKLIRPMNGLTEKALSYAPKQARDQVHSLMLKWNWGTEFAPPPSSQKSASTKKEPAGIPGPAK